MKKRTALCALLCAAFLLAACSTPGKLTQPSGRWVDANPPSSYISKGGN